MSDEKQIRVETGSNTPWGLVALGIVSACAVIGLGAASLSGSFGFHPLDPEADARAVLISTQGAKATEQKLEFQAQINELALAATATAIAGDIEAEAEFEEVKSVGRQVGKALLIAAGSALTTGGAIGLVLVGDAAQKKRKQFKTSRVGVALLQATNPKGDNMFIDEITGETWKADEPHKPSPKRIEAITQLMQSGRQVQIFAGEKASAPGDGLEIIQATPINTTPTKRDDIVIEGEFNE